MGIASRLNQLWRGSLGSRIALAYAALMIACVGALTIYLVAVSRDFYLSTLHQGAEAQAKLVGEAVLPYLSPPHTPSEIDSLVKRLGQQSGIRVTIVDRDGVVLGDSEQDPTKMENHGGRPEVRDALSQGVGESNRRSASVGYDTSYVAVPIRENGQLVGVSRVAIPLSNVNRTAAGIAVAVAIGGLLAIGLAVALALLIAGGITSPIRQLTAIARQMAEGRLDRRVGDYSEDEVGQLGSA
ncbi:MAG TPA: HAMP domain-containing protein, partial [Chloroflexota bacterium]|nr:HAMP domain-containing protein [Chloroflexota bacterium]